MIVVEIKPAKKRFGIFRCTHWTLQIWSADGSLRYPDETYKNVDDIKDILLAIRTGRVVAKVHYQNTLRMEIVEACKGVKR